MSEPSYLTSLATGDPTGSDKPVHNENCAKEKACSDAPEKAAQAPLDKAIDAD